MEILSKTHQSINVVFGQIQDIEILGWCPAGSVIPHVEKVLL